MDGREIETAADLLADDAQVCAAASYLLLSDFGNCYVFSHFPFGLRPSIYKTVIITIIIIVIIIVLYASILNFRDNFNYRAALISDFGREYYYDIIIIHNILLL